MFGKSPMLYHSLTIEEFLPKMNCPGIDIIDVREEQECLSGMIPGAINIPLSTLPEYEFDHQCKEVVFYCRSGHRSKIAAQIFLEKYRTMKLPEISHLKGGYLAWAAWKDNQNTPIDEDLIPE